MGYQLTPLTITNSMLLRAASIAEKAALAGSGKQTSARDKKRVRATLLTEGRAQADPAGLLEAYERLSEADPFRVKDLLKFHGIAAAGRPDAGAFRRQGTGIVFGDGAISVAPAAESVGTEAEELLAALKREQKDMHPLLLSILAHYELALLHPFDSLNGCMARLWQTALLRKWNPCFALYSPEEAIEKNRERYYAVLARCRVSGEADPFAQLMLELIEASLPEKRKKEILEKAAPKQSPCVKKLLCVMRKGVPYPTAEIMKRLGLKSRETFRAHYMDPALEAGLVVMTVPDKPTSRNQKYIKL